MSKQKKPQTIEYALRFAKGSNTDRARMAEMIRVNIGELVKIIVLTHAGQNVQVDGFRLRDDPQCDYRLDEPIV
jgi:hypothetical protein